jgi:hypothetical protein
MSDYLQNLQEGNTSLYSFIARDPSRLDEAKLDKFIEEMNLVDEPEGIELEESLAGSLAAIGVLSALSIIGAIYAAIKLNVPNPECEKYSMGYKAKCNRIMNLRKRVFTLRSKMVLCNNAQNPEQCKAGIKKEIEEMGEKIQKAGTIEGHGGTKGTGIQGKKKESSLKNPKERKISISFKHKKG